jgi:hypothetical protein
MKINQIKEVLNSIFEEDESLKYALATNLAKYGRPQSKKSDKPAKLTKGLEKGREKYVKDLKKSMSEDKGRDMAREFISKMRDAMRSLSDDELDTFRKDIAQAFDLNMNESVNESEGAFVVTAKKDGEPDASFAYADEDMAKKFKVELDKDGYTTTISRKKVDGVAESVNEDKGTLNKIADMLDRKFPDLRFDVNTTSDRIDVRGSRSDLADFGEELHGEKIFDYEVFYLEEDPGERGAIVRIVKSDSIMRGGVNEEEKKKADRCLRIARRKMPQSSAYRSGLIVKCRKGMIWKSEK